MDLVSLLIMIIGIIILLGLYLMGRLYDQTPAKQSNKEIKIPLYTDASGKQLSSISADIPAKGNGKPAYTRMVTPPRTQRTQAAQTSNAKATDNKSSSTSVAPAKQHILFIAAQTVDQLNGNKILAAMQQLGFKFGEKNIYHYLVKDKPVFSVANGVEPWTLNDSDLIDKSTPGLSLIMKMPAPVDSVTAIEIFVDVAEKLASAINGELQNAQQQLFLPTDKEMMLAAKHS